MEKIGIIGAIKKYFPDIRLDELKSLSAEDRFELASLAAEELKVELTAIGPLGY